MALGVEYGEQSKPREGSICSRSAWVRPQLGCRVRGYLFYLHQSGLKPAEVFSIDGRAGLLGVGSKDAGSFQGFAYVLVAFSWLIRSAFTAGPSGGALVLGFGRSWSKRSLIAARRGLQTLNGGTNRI